MAEQAGRDHLRRASPVNSTSMRTGPRCSLVGFHGKNTGTPCIDASARDAGVSETIWKHQANPKRGTSDKQPACRWQGHDRGLQQTKGTRLSDSKQGGGGE